LAPVPVMNAVIWSVPSTHSGNGGIENAASSCSSLTSEAMS